MCWAMRIAIPPQAAAKGIGNVQKYDGMVSKNGQKICYLESAGQQRSWNEARFGIELKQGASSRLFWNAREDKLRINESWTRLIGQRVAIPIDAYVDSNPSVNWYAGPRAWLPGLISRDVDGGIVTITEDSPRGRRPILLCDQDAISWIDCKVWDALKTLTTSTRLIMEEASECERTRLKTGPHNFTAIAA